MMGWVTKTGPMAMSARPHINLFFQSVVVS